MSEAFNLESAPVAGEIPQRVVEELMAACVCASDMSTAYGDALKAQADKHKLKPKALRKYITALVADKLDDARIEAQQLSDLLG